jgi:hypothetical protein
MSFLFTSPQIMASAAGDLANIGSTLNEARSAALPATTDLLPAAEDEISQALASLFAGHAESFQAIGAKVSQFHDQFVQLLSGGAQRYVEAELGNVSPLAAAPGQMGDFLTDLQAGQLNFNANLVQREFGFNASLLNQELGFENSFLGAGAFNGGENRFFNAENMFIGTSEGVLNSAVGATGWSPSALTASLLTGSSAQVFNGGAIGGLEGLLDQSLAANADLTGLLRNPALPLPVIGSTPIGTTFANLATSQLNFNANLVAHEFGFNTALLNGELGFEHSFLGDDALNGAVNRMFNAMNLPFGTAEGALNSVVGATNWTPADLTGSLLTGTGQQVFNGGLIGGFEGFLDQTLASTADEIGFLASL